MERLSIIILQLKLINELETEMKEYLNTVGFLVYILRNNNTNTIKTFSKKNQINSF
jgi:hypothetical protein